MVNYICKTDFEIFLSRHCCHPRFASELWVMFFSFKGSISYVKPVNLKGDITVLSPYLFFS